MVMAFWKREDNGYFYYTDVSIMKSLYRAFQSITHTQNHKFRKVA